MNRRTFLTQLALGSIVAFLPALFFKKDRLNNIHNWREYIGPNGAKFRMIHDPQFDENVKYMAGVDPVTGKDGYHVYVFDLNGKKLWMHNTQMNMYKNYDDQNIQQFFNNIKT